ncbi:hypothetical protein NIE88_07600 [Sporolactobacillus shoreicorticis]|uniref:Uncharacterized protein n=1 Tax=Sporolactobacillus shoreicorticis TaxID=1923877 RepID=A0ABW5S789_9BACL|nr:hypothetical protein [Sporolactobacillus shoreicorticis]MCO7125632.1 hypothetical protein [Sporolactobacillus shoreicorticis]
MKRKILLILPLLISLFFVGVQPISAEEAKVDYGKIYNEGIADKAIDPVNVNYADWITQNNTEFIPVYRQAINAKIINSNTSYAEWLRANNYGQMPEDNSNDLMVYTLAKSGGSFKFRTGDMLLTNHTSSYGILGHIAIATSSINIVDLPGKSGLKPLPNNNRHISIKKWLSQYSKGKEYVKVYRIKSKSLANKVGTYAYHRFWAGKYSSGKHVHITYSLTPHLYSLSPSYCSKLVFQAYYYGSGKEKVVVPERGIVTPYGMVNKNTPHPVIYKKYGLKLVKTY